MSSNKLHASAECKLPAPDLAGPLQRLIIQRRSRRNFKRGELTPAQLALLLWSAQGCVADSRRAVPSAGATYPLDVLVALDHPGVTGLAAGLYRYEPAKNALLLRRPGNLLHQIVDACYGQSFIAAAPVVLIIVGELSRIASRYGDRSRRYIYMEAGHVGQNVHLAAESLGLGTVMVGAFDDAELARVLHLPHGHEPVYVFPIGTPA
ncbi:MAG: SagB/ThcOx family dehydrogenase [Planctomycetota bacterium]